MVRDRVRTLQRELAELGIYAGRIDGIRGPRTEAAVERLLALFPAAPDAAGWSARRRAVAALQLLAGAAGIDAGPVDGRWGPQTEFAADALAARERGALPARPADRRAGPFPPPPNPNGWPSGTTDTGLEAHYGPHGRPAVPDDPGFTPPLERVACPWDLTLAWNRRQKVGAIAVHRLCAASLGRVLARVHAHYGAARLEGLGLGLFGGSYNPRPMRGSDRWSVHAWGAAIDWDPEANRLRWNGTRARMAGPDYDAWWGIWEEEGWIGLGRARDFDWMHVQAATL
jgi:hypothetical protein